MSNGFVQNMGDLCGGGEWWWWGRGCEKFDATRKLCALGGCQWGVVYLCERRVCLVWHNLK